jgi:hypothetical protein
MQRASNELVVGFDDDSWPMDEDFFGEVIRLFDGFSPKCALVACQIIHRGESIPPRVGTLGRAASFVGCGAVFRRSAILDIGGYTPVVYGHGFEETDLALRLWDSDHVIMGTDQLRVFHDTDLSHHVSPAVNGAQITNLALVALLRYPLSMQWYGAFQILNRVFYSMRMGRFGGILHGLGKIPSEFWRLRQCRIPVNARTVWRFRELMSRGQRL